MANIGSLVVNLQANSAAFLAEMQKARTATERVARGVEQGTAVMSRSFQAVTNHVRGFLAAFSLTAIAHFAKQLVDTAGGLGELSEQLGVSTGFLQAMQYQAAQSGVSAEQLQTAFIRLNDTIGSAAEGSDEAIKTFNRLGIMILDGSGNVRNAEAVFDDLAERIRSIEDPARRAAAANDLLGRTGARLLPLLSQGAEGIRLAREEAERAGVIISQEMIDNADKLSDALAAVKIQLAAIATSPAIAVFQTIADTLKFLRDWTPRGLEMVDRALGGQAVNDALEDEMVRLSGRAEDLRDAIASVNIGDAFNMPTQEAVRHLEELRTELDLVTERMDELRRYFEDRDRGSLDVVPPVRISTVHPRGVRNPVGRSSGRDAARVLEDLQRQMNALSTPNAERQTFIDQWVGKLPEAVSRTSTLAERVRNLAGAFYDAQQSNRVLNDAFEDGQRISEQMMTQQERLQNQLANLNYLREVGAISQTTYNRAVSDAWLTTSGLGKAVESLGDAFSNAFEDAIVKGQSLRDVLGSLLSDIGRLLIRLAVLEPIKQAITSGLGNLFGGSTFVPGSGTGNTSRSAMGNILTSRGPLALASGGVVTSPHVALIGEGMQDEAVVPLPNNRKIPVDLRGGRSGNTFVTNIDARGSDAGVLIRVQAMLDQRDARLLAAIPQLSRDGGGFARSVGARKR